MSTTIELNDLSPLVPIPSIESICDPQSDAKLIDFDSSTNFPLNHNSLMIAAERGDSNAVNLCLKSGCNVNEKVNGKTAVDLAWKNQHFDIVLDLLKANSQLPKDFDVSMATEEIKEFVESKKSKKFKIFGSDDAIKNCRSCGKYQIKVLLVLIIAFPIIVWFGLRLKMPDVDPIYSCGNLTDELRSKIFESAVEFQNVNVNFGDLFGRNLIACEHLSTEEVTSMLKAAGSLKPLLKINKMVQTHTKFYIERLIKSSDPSSDVSSDTYYGFDELTNLKLILLSDKGGSGKSTYFRHMAWKLKRRFPLKWISYVNLKQHIHVLQDVPKTDANLTTVVDFLSSKILNLTSKVDIGVFERKFLSNESVILWDGVDEISPMLTDESLKLSEQKTKKLKDEGAKLARKKIVDGVLGFIDVIAKLTDNKQWIAARPYLRDSIKRKLRIEETSFVRFDEDDRRKFVEGFVGGRNRSDMPLELLERKYENFIGDLNRKIEVWNRNDKDWISLDENLNVFGIVCDQLYNSIESGVEPSLYTIYQEYYYQILVGSFNLSQNASMESQKVGDKISEIHQHFAFAPILKYAVFDPINTDFVYDFTKLQIYNMTDISDFQEILRLGFVHKHKNGIIFEDEMLQNFFIAQYFYQNVWNLRNSTLEATEADLRLRFLIHFFFKSSVQYKVINVFIAGFVDAYSNATEPALHPVFRDIMTKQYDDTLISLSIPILTSINGTDVHDVIHTNRVEAVTRFFKKDFKILNSLWKIDENRTFFYKFLELSVKADQVKDISRITTEYFSKENARKILKGKFQTANILSILWHNGWNSSYSNAVMDATGYEFDTRKLQDIQNFGDFMKFLLHQNYSKEEIREFFYGNINVMNKEADGNIYKKYASELLTSEDYKDVMEIWSIRDFVSEFYI